MYSVDPKPTSSSSKIETFEIFPFSKQGVILAIIVSSFLNLAPPLYSSKMNSVISLQNGCNLSIGIFFAMMPLPILSLGLI